MSGAQDQLSFTREASFTRGRAQEQFHISYFSGTTAEGVLALMRVSAKPIRCHPAERRLVLHQETPEQANSERTAPR
jgi:hypothetical protein